MKLDRFDPLRLTATCAAFGSLLCVSSLANCQAGTPQSEKQRSSSKAPGSPPDPNPNGQTQKKTADTNPAGGFTKQVTITNTDPVTINDDPIAANLEALMETAINDTRVKVAVRRIEGPGVKSRIYLAVLGGSFHDKKASLAAQATAEAIVKSSGLDNLVMINRINSDDPEPGQIEVSYIWQCGFLQGNTDSECRLSLINLADGLNTLFPCEAGGVPIISVRDLNLLLHGPQNSVRKIRAILAMIDAPTPEVKLEVWAIQYAGSQADVGKRIFELNDEIAQAQRAAEMAKQALAFAVQQNAADVRLDDSFTALRSVGFDVDPRASLSLIESLICIGISSHRANLVKDAVAAIKQLLRTDDPSKSDVPWISARLKDDANCFPNLTKLLAQPGGKVPGNTVDSDILSVNRFATSLKTYISFIDALGLYGTQLGKAPDKLLDDHPSAPEALSRESLTFNRQLERLVDALSADMQAMFFTPLLQRAQQWNYGGRGGGGIGLAGKTDIVVNSRLNADVTAQLELYAEHQAPRTLGEDYFSHFAPAITGQTPAPPPQPAAATTSTAGSVTTTTTITSPGGTVASSPAAAVAPVDHISQLLTGISPLERGLVLGALQPTADISYYRVAPGIDIHVTPTMTPDGTSANLKLDATFGEDTSMANAANTLANTFRPPDAVKQHRVQTVANVGGFNLFEVSSFNMDTEYPRPPFILPILGNLPLVGNVFRFERGVNRTYHQSIILVNATLTPRSLGLIGFYGSNFAGRGSLIDSARSRGGDGKLDYEEFISAKR